MWLDGTYNIYSWIKHFFIALLKMTTHTHTPKFWIFFCIKFVREIYWKREDHKIIKRSAFKLLSSRVFRSLLEKNGKLRESASVWKVNCPENWIKTKNKKKNHSKENCKEICAINSLSFSQDVLLKGFYFWFLKSKSCFEYSLDKQQNPLWIIALLFSTWKERQDGKDEWIKKDLFAFS